MVKVFAVNGSYCEYIGAYNQTTIKILNGNNDTLITKAGSPVVLYNLPSTITNNITLQNRYINDTGYMLTTFFTHKVMGSVNIPAGDTTSIFNYNFMSGTFSNSSTEYTKALEKKINVSSGKGINPFATGNFALGVEGIGMDIALIGLAAAVPTGGVGLAIKEAGAVMAGIGFAFDAAQSATVTYTFTWQNAAFSEMQLTNFAFSSDPGFTTYFYSSQSVIWDFPNGSSAEVNMPEPYFNMVAD